jgi:HEAT repeat protein
MAKGGARKTLEAQIAELRAVREDPTGPEARAQLERALASGRAPLVTVAANIVGEAELSGFSAGLRAAFERHMADPVKLDPGCAAKTSVVNALYRLAERACDVYLRGVHHVQREPIWGGSQDTAVELRGVCALALVRADYPDALLELADLLADPEPPARAAAAQAIAYSERADVGLPLLRVKARLGDADPRVTSACFAGLLALAPDRSLPFVAGFLGAAQVETREAALLALGESRNPAALEPLRGAIEAALSAEERQIAYTAVALMRNDAAWDYLLSVLNDGTTTHAAAALEALATYRSDPALRARTLAAVQARGDAKLRARAGVLFDATS